MKPADPIDAPDIGKRVRQEQQHGQYNHNHCPSGKWIHPPRAAIIPRKPEKKVDSDENQCKMIPDIANPDKEAENPEDFVPLSSMNDELHTASKSLMNRLIRCCRLV